MNSIEMVVSKKAEATVVDSLSLANYLSRHYYQKPELHLEASWGPLPPHPILVNSKLPGTVPDDIFSVYIVFKRFLLIVLSLLLFLYCVSINYFTSLIYYLLLQLNYDRRLSLPSWASTRSHLGKNSWQSLVLQASKRLPLTITLRL